MKESEAMIWGKGRFCDWGLAVVAWVVSGGACLGGELPGERVGSEARSGVEASSTVRVMSYNIRHGEGMDGRIDLDRIAGVIAGESPDLVALQEVDRQCPRSGGVDLAAELGRRLGMHSAFGAFMSFQGGEYGMAVLSRYPIGSQVRHVLPEGAEPRCALEVQVRMPGWEQPLSFVGIHSDWTSEGYRVQQVQTLLGALASHEHPVILAGDFNGKRTDASLELLEKAGWSIVQKAGDANTWPADSPRVEIDYVVLRGFVNPLVVHDVMSEQVASDHRPIRATIRDVRPPSKP